jgi:hypothetical protein
MEHNAQPVSDTSHSTMKSRSKSGSYRIGAMVSTRCSARNAASASALHLNVSILNNAVNGVVMAS